MLYPAYYSILLFLPIILFKRLILLSHLMFSIFDGRNNQNHPNLRYMTHNYSETSIIRTPLGPYLTVLIIEVSEVDIVQQATPLNQWGSLKLPRLTKKA